MVLGIRSGEAREIGESPHVFRVLSGYIRELLGKIMISSQVYISMDTHAREVLSPEG